MCAVCPAAPSASGPCAAGHSAPLPCSCGWSHAAAGSSRGLPLEAPQLPGPGSVLAGAVAGLTARRLQPRDILPSGMATASHGETNERRPEAATIAAGLSEAAGGVPGGGPKAGSGVVARRGAGAGCGLAWRSSFAAGCPTAPLAGSRPARPKANVSWKAACVDGPRLGRAPWLSTPPGLCRVTLTLCTCWADKGAEATHPEQDRQGTAERRATHGPHGQPAVTAGAGSAPRRAGAAAARPARQPARPTAAPTAARSWRPHVRRARPGRRRRPPPRRPAPPQRPAPRAAHARAPAKPRPVEHAAQNILMFARRQQRVAKREQLIYPQRMHA